MVKKQKGRHLSGRNKEQLPRSISDWKGEEIPVTKDSGTFIYLAEADGVWPKKPVVALPLDVQWLEPGLELRVRDIRPDFFTGDFLHVRVLDTDVQIEIRPGKWGQIRRNVLVEQIATPEALNQAVQEELDD